MIKLSVLRWWMLWPDALMWFSIPLVLIHDKMWFIATFITPFIAIYSDEKYNWLKFNRE